MSSHFSNISGSSRSVTNPYRVLIAGGCYSGLAAAINLLEKCDTIDSPIPVDITIVDERDGFCMSRTLVSYIVHSQMRY